MRSSAQRRKEQHGRTNMPTRAVMIVKNVDRISRETHQQPTLVHSERRRPGTERREEKSRKEREFADRQGAKSKGSYIKQARNIVPDPYSSAS